MIFALFNKGSSQTYHVFQRSAQKKAWQGQRKILGVTMEAKAAQLIKPNLIMYKNLKNYLKKGINK